MPYTGKKRPALQRNKSMDAVPKKKTVTAKRKKIAGPAKKQGRNARLDESLGMRRGAESTKSQSMSSRRNESRGMDKPKVFVKKKTTRPPKKRSKAY